MENLFDGFSKRQLDVMHDALVDAAQNDDPESEDDAAVAADLVEELDRVRR